MAFLLYSLTTLAVLWLAGRFVRPISRPAALVLFVLPLGIVGPALVTDRVYGPIDHLYQHEPWRAMAAGQGISTAAARNVSAIDVISEFFPWRHAVRMSYARGEWPLWNPYKLCGHPLAAEAQAAPYSPFTLLSLLLPAPVSMSYSAAMALFLAGISAFLLARELDCGEGPALIAAAGWGLAPCIVIYSQTAMGQATVYLPLLLLATRRVVTQPGLAAGALLTTSLTLTLLEGHPESLFLNVIIGCVFGLFELARHWRKPRQVLGAVGAAVASGVVALGLGAIFILPLLDAIPQSIEYVGRSSGSQVLRHGVSGEHSLAILTTTLFPHLHVRYWEQPALGFIGVETATTGSLVLALALYALWRRRTPDTWFLLALGLTSMIVGTRWLPIVKTLQKLPLLSITHHERLSFAAVLCLVMLAALGAEEAVRRKDYRAAGVTAAVLLIVLTGGMFWLSRNVVIGVSEADIGRYRGLADFFFLAAAVLALAIPIRPRIVLPLVLGLLTGQRLMSEVDTFGTFPARSAFPPVPVLEALRNVEGPFRIVGHEAFFPPEASTFYGLEDVRGYEALTLDPFTRTWKLWCRRHGIWFNRVDDLSAPILSLMNVRFAIQADSAPIPSGWRRIASQPGSALIENSAVIERVFIPENVVVGAAGAVDVVDRMSQVQDFRRKAFITADGSMLEQPNGPGRITLRSRRAGGEYHFDAEMQRDSWVVISDSAWRGWRAFVDGKEVSMHYANAAFLSLRVPAGRHSVRVVYRPIPFVQGRVISFSTLAGILIMALVLAVRRRHKS